MCYTHLPYSLSQTSKVQSPKSTKQTIEKFIDTLDLFKVLFTDIIRVYETVIATYT